MAGLQTPMSEMELEQPLVVGTSMHNYMNIHAEMCMVWGLNPRETNGEGWTSNECPPWNPTWSDFMCELTYDQQDLCYLVCEPTYIDLSYDELCEIPLEYEHILKICHKIKSYLRPRNVTEVEEYDDELPGNPWHYEGSEIDDELIEERLEIWREDSGDSEINNVRRELFGEFGYFGEFEYDDIIDDYEEEEPQTNYENLKDCQRGLQIIEECMETKSEITEGMYLELSNIFMKLSKS